MQSASGLAAVLRTTLSGSPGYGLERGAKTRANRRLGLAPLSLAIALAMTPARAEEPQRELEVEIPTAPVAIDGRVLFQVRGTSSFPAPERAAAIAARIVGVARDASIPAESISLEPVAVGVEIRAGDRLLMHVVPADAALESVLVPTLADAHRQRIRMAIAQYRAEREPRRLLYGLALAIFATAAFAALVMVIQRVFRRMASRAQSLLAARIERLPDTARHLTQPHQLQDAITTLLRAIRWLALIVLGFLWLQFALSQFPWTRALSEQLLAVLIEPLEQMGAHFLEFVPSLVFLVMLAAVTRYGLRLLRLLFAGVERRTLRIGAFDPAWADPAYKLVRALVIALALVMAYPYLPGSGSEALRGISVLGGLMLSLGASAMVGNILAGYMNTFGRIFRVGDIVKLGEVAGQVTQVRLLTTRVRTPKNEEVTLPNSMVYSNPVVNYSALAQSNGLLLHTEVGIGYEVPWRQVHAMLEEAARRTPGLRREPPPFILQRKLGDFAVIYELNVYSSEPGNMLLCYSRLHESVLDVFNEHGVQIMTPAYEHDPPQPKIVPREQWFAAPAKPPGEAPSA